MQLLTKSLNAAVRMKFLLIAVAMLYVFSFLAGSYLVSLQVPFATQLKLGVHQAVLTKQPFLFVLDFLKQGELLKAIVATFFVNFVMGAFLTTMLPGIVPAMGGLFIVGVTLARGFAVGVTYPEVLAASPASFIVGLGTLIFELGAYVFSGAAGMNVALAPFFPQRYGVRTRLAALRAALIEALQVLPIVAVLLLVGAVWEMTGLFLLTHR